MLRGLGNISKMPDWFGNSHQSAAQIAQFFPQLAIAQRRRNHQFEAGLK